MILTMILLFVVGYAFIASWPKRLKIVQMAPHISSAMADLSTTWATRARYWCS